MDLILAVALGLAILAVGFGTLRGFVRGAPPSLDPEDATPAPPNVRVLFWCGTCGTELLLIRKGTDAPPRHCGETMTRREEVPLN